MNSQSTSTVVVPYHNSIQFHNHSQSLLDSDDPNHKCDVDVLFGPWHGTPSVPDLIHCIVSDMRGLGYSNIQPVCIGICDQPIQSKNKNQNFCRRSIYTITIHWW